MPEFLSPSANWAMNSSVPPYFLGGTAKNGEETRATLIGTLSGLHEMLASVPVRLRVAGLVIDRCRKRLSRALIAKRDGNDYALRWVDRTCRDDDRSGALVRRKREIGHVSS